MGLNSVLGLRLPNMAPSGATDEMVTFVSWIVLRKQKYTCIFYQFWILRWFRNSNFLDMSYILSVVAAVVFYYLSKLLSYSILLAETVKVQFWGLKHLK